VRSDSGRNNVPGEGPVTKLHFSYEISLIQTWKEIQGSKLVQLATSHLSCGNEYSPCTAGIPKQIAELLFTTALPHILRDIVSPLRSEIHLNNTMFQIVPHMKQNASSKKDQSFNARYIKERHLF